MAKTIKFNLICDGYPVRTLDELREHFSIEDVLTYHRSGMLQRWLEVRGFTKALDAVREVPVTDQMKAANPQPCFIPNNMNQYLREVSCSAWQCHAEPDKRRCFHEQWVTDV